MVPTQLSPLHVSPDDLRPIVFVNPRAGRGRARRYFTSVRELFEYHSCRVDFLETKSRQELEELAGRSIEHGRRTLIAMGGDGTVQGLVSAALGSAVTIGILPTGGGNDFAAALGFSSNPIRAAKSLLSGKPRLVDVARARTADGYERIYVGGGGIGLDAEAARYAATHYGHWPGRVRYVASALHALRGFAPLHLRAQLWKSSFEEMQSTILVACVLNTPTYGGGLRLAPKASVDDGLLDVTMLEYLRLPKILSLLPRLVVSGEINTPGMQRAQCSRVRLVPDRPCVFHGDGEIFGPAPVEIEVVPQAVSVLAPRRKESAAQTGFSSCPSRFSGQ